MKWPNSVTPDKLFAFKDHRLAQHFLGVAAAGNFVRHRQLHGGRIAALAVSPRQKRRRPRRAAAFAQRTNRRKLNCRKWRKPSPPKKPRSAAGDKIKESLLRRKYVIPFLLACVILACNQATGVNSIIGYNTTILIQAGLGDQQAHLGYVIFTIVNFLITIVAVVLVDRKGRKFLLSLGSAGVIVSLLCVGLLFHKTEKLRVDVKDAVQAMVTTNQTLTLAFNEQTADQSSGRQSIIGQPTTLIIIYSYGDFQRGNRRRAFR